MNHNFDKMRYNGEMNIIFSKVESKLTRRGTDENVKKNRFSALNAFKLEFTFHFIIQIQQAIKFLPYVLSNTKLPN